MIRWPRKHFSELQGVGFVSGEGRYSDPGLVFNKCSHVTPEEGFQKEDKYRNIGMD